MIERVQGESYDAFGDALVADTPRPARAGLSLLSIVALFWIAALVLVGGRVYVEMAWPGPGGRAASSHSPAPAAMP